MSDNAIISLSDIVVRHISFNEYTDSSAGNFCHDKFEIVYHENDCGYAAVEGVQYKLDSGSLILINPFAYHKVWQQGGETPSLWSVQFAKSILPEGVRDMFDAVVGDDDNSGRFYPGSTLGALDGVFSRFALCSNMPKEQMRAYISALMSELIILMSVAESHSISLSGQCLGARVVSYLNKNIERNISLDKLAKRFFVSKYHLCRAFKEYSGISVHSYINQKRIMYARQLIESGTTAAGAAEKVGFGDYSAFYRAYVKIVGKSPTAN
jgi:AraC-like DNA-binding protein